MTEPEFLRAIRASYDAVAEGYARRFGAELAAKPLDRAMLAGFAELVRSAGNLPVADIGCGTGRVTAHLATLGLAVSGIDLSPGMVEMARQSHPELRRMPDHVADLLGQAGLVVRARLLREPDDEGDFTERTRQAFVLARKPRQPGPVP